MSDVHHGSANHPHGDAPASPEPKTPLWLSAVGGLLFLVAALAWALAPGTPSSTTTAVTTADAGAPRR